MLFQDAASPTGEDMGPPPGEDMYQASGSLAERWVRRRLETLRDERYLRLVRKDWSNNRYIRGYLLNF